MEINKLTQRLLNEGYTEDQTPPGCNPWNRFYGGWTYNYRNRLNTVFETPCGLLVKRTEIGHSGAMGYMGIDWTEENDNVTILCPHYSRNGTCELNHPLLEDLVRSNSARYHHVDDVIAAIAGQPTVDAVEVVRCKDCKDSFDRANGTRYCSRTGKYVSSNDFCSYGERRN